MPSDIQAETGWVVSTGHMTRDDSVRLQTLLGHDLLASNPASRSFGCLLLSSYDGGYVFTFWTTQECLDEDHEDVYKAFVTEHGLSDALLTLIRAAVAAECRYLRFDIDGDVYDHLQHFEW
jgi:hypothetical protein